MKSNKLRLIFDSIYIIIQTTFNMSIVASLFDMVLPIPYGLNLLALSMLFHILRFGLNIKVFGFIKRYPILIVFFIIMGMDIIQNLFLIPGNSFVRFVLLLNAILFMDYLYQMSIEQTDYSKRLGAITTSYSVYSIYNIIVIVLSASLIVLGLLNPLSNPIELQLMGDNIEQGQLYYFPGYLSVVTQDTRLFTDSSIPMLCGLSHEPHVVALLVVPGIIFSLAYIKNDIVRFVLSFLCFLAIVLGQSTTAIVCFVFIMALHLSNVLIKQKKKTEVILSAIVIIGVFIYLSTFMGSLLEMVTSKLAGEGGSKDYSTSMLSYITHPDFVFGYGNLPPVVGEKAVEYNIGFISSFLDIVFFIMLIISSLKAFRSNNHYSKYVGLGVLYFSLHGLKLSYLLFGYPFLVYILFCLCYSTSKIHVKKAI